MRGASVLSGLVLSFFILIGTSGPALSAFLCGSGICGDRCPMVTPKPQPPPCCPQADAEKEAPAPTDCDCKLSSQNDALPLPVGFAIPQTPLLALILSAIELHLVGFVPAPLEAAICFYSDSSPPSVAWVPDLGRAPPLV